MTAAANPTPSYKLELASSEGSVFRDVLKTAPRNCNPSEVPAIDLSDLNGTEQQRQALAKLVRAAAENTGFFYVKNHGVPRAKIDSTYRQASNFFAQPRDKKLVVSQGKSKYFCGWTDIRGSHASPSESRDNKEGFLWRYDPKYDPETKDGNAIPEEVKPWLWGEEYIWEGTSYLNGFKEDVLGYWRECLSLARRMIRIFALALDMSEDYFDNIITYPGSDGLLNYYPKNTTPLDSDIDVGVGAHTDLQCFTILSQDGIGGLQVLSKEGQWLKVPPVSDTFLINIGDFMKRLSNDRFQSTVHRVINFSAEDRYSVAFFFGFNFNEKCAVLPSCTSRENPPKYEPISCGEWAILRYAKTFKGPSVN